MKYSTAVKTLSRMHPSEAEMHRQLHTLPSHKLREYLDKLPQVKNAIYARIRDIDAADRAIAELDRTVPVIQKILADRVCVAS